MKHLSILCLAFCALILLSANCNNGGSTSTTDPKDSTVVVENTDPKDTTVVEEDTLMPTGGIKPLPVTPQAARQKLYDQYKNGEIEMCMYEGNTVYRCSRNAPDAGSEVFDHQANRIGRCYYSTRQVDPICEKATGCKVIYRVEKNIWGKPGVPWTGN